MKKVTKKKIAVNLVRRARDKGLEQEAEKIFGMSTRNACFQITRCLTDEGLGALYNLPVDDVLDLFFARRPNDDYKFERLLQQVVDLMEGRQAVVPATSKYVDARIYAAAFPEPPLTTKSVDETADTEPVDVTSTTTPTGNATPTHSTSSLSLQHEVAPWAGQTFIIRHRDSKLVITLGNGQLKLVPAVGDEAGWHWACVENAGWFGFRNVVSGTYLGHDGDAGYHAEGKLHGSNELFVARHHPSGGYQLLSEYERQLFGMNVIKWEDDGLELAQGRIYDTLWEFVRG